jgi:Zn-dependent protease with chaperone function
MDKKIALLLGIVYLAASAYLLKIRIDFSGADSARGVGFSVLLGMISYIVGVYLFISPRKLNKSFGVILLLISFALLVIQVWFRSYYPHVAL